jgi:tetratricopeptide (TPR) repeat protein
MDDRPDSAFSSHRPDITDSRGVQAGDHNTQYNLFAVPPPPGPVVAGNVPQVPPAFQPREDLMTQLRTSGPGVSVVRAVTGLRGVGKTQLAAAYARECRQAGWRLVAWVNAETTPAILDGLAVVADRLGIDRTGKPLEVLGTEVRNRMEADGERCLIVFDNVTDPDAVLPYVPSIGHPQVLITSTESSVTALGKPVQVTVFTEQEALAFLADRTRLDDVAGARTLVRELGYLPLALSQAAAVIAARHLTYLVYLTRLHSYPAQKYLPPARGEPYPRGTAEAIGLSIDTVTAADPAGFPSSRAPAGLCRALLDIVSLLSPDGVSREVLYLGEPAEVFGASIEDLDEELGRLASASLLTFTTGTTGPPTVIAHRLVMRVTRERAAHDGTLVDLAMKAATLLGAYAESLGEAWQNRGAVRDFVRQVTALAENVASEPRAADDDRLLDLRSQTLWCVLELGSGSLSYQAVEIGEKLLADNDRVRGPDHQETLIAQENLASAYRMSGRVNEAVPLLERVVSEQQRVLGGSDPRMLTSQHNLAHAYREAGRIGEAISLLERVLAECERLFGESHPDTLIPRGNLALAYQHAGRVGEAVALLERMVAECERVFGESHPNTLATWSALADAYRIMGRAGEAVVLLERVIPEQQRMLGQSHPDTLISRHALADAYRDAGRASDAVALSEQVLAERERVLGESHPDTLASVNGLALAYQAAGRMSETVPLHERALAGLERTLGADHPATVVVRGHLARARGEATAEGSVPSA